MMKTKTSSSDSFKMKKKDRFAAWFQGRELYFVCGGKCIKLTSINGEKAVSEEVEELHSNQEEADTKIVLLTLHASKHSSDDATVTV